MNNANQKLKLNPRREIFIPYENRLLKGGFLICKNVDT